jgi:hypothetical protein
MSNSGFSSKSKIVTNNNPSNMSGGNGTTTATTSNNMSRSIATANTMKDVNTATNTTTNIATRKVQLFPRGNDGILIINNTNSIPSIMRDPMVFDKDNVPIAFNRANTKSKLYIGNADFTVTNVAISDKYVTFTDENNLEVTVKSPEIEIVQSENDVINVNNNTSVNTVIGKISDLYWSPKYIAQLDDDYNLDKLSLVANIINNNSKLASVKTITFSLLSLLDTEANNINTPYSYNQYSDMQPVSSAKMATRSLSANSISLGSNGQQLVEESGDYSYSISGDYTLYRHNVIPLWTSQLGTPEVGYIFVPSNSSSNNKDKVFSGYDIDTNPNLYLPPGSVTLMRNGIVYKEVSMPKAIANNLRLVVSTIPNITVISNNTFKEEGRLQIVTLHYDIQNSNNYDLDVKIVLPVGNIDVLKINSDQPQPNHDQARRELTWPIVCKGDNTNMTFDVEFIIGNK